MSGASAAAGRAWRLAVPISMMSAALGLGRELVILHRVGLSESNDLLQYYLSITYTISLLGDAIRLAVLNLLQAGALAGALTSTLIVGLAAGVPITLWYAHGRPALDGDLLILAGVAGVLNLITLALLVHRQRAGRFLPAHVVTALPNIVIFAGVVVALRFDTAGFITAVVGLFLVAPIIQITLLLGLRPAAGTPAVAGDGLAADVSRGVRWIGLHGVGSVGAQAGQIVIRTALAAQGPGMLTVFVLLSRAVDTIRGILLDTLIGARLADWAAGRGRVPALLDPVHLAPAVLGVIVLATGAASLADADTAAAVAPWMAIVLLPGAWLAFLQRAGVFYLNATGSPRGLILRLGLIDAGVAAVLAAGAAAAGLPVLVLVWGFFVVRVALQVGLIRRAGRAGGN